MRSGTFPKARRQEATSTVMVAGQRAARTAQQFPRAGRQPLPTAWQCSLLTVKPAAYCNTVVVQTKPTIFFHFHLFWLLWGEKKKKKNQQKCYVYHGRKIQEPKINGF